MLVKELIQHLQKYNGDLEVYYECDKGVFSNGHYHGDVNWPWLAEKVVWVQNYPPEKDELREVDNFILIRKIWEADDEEAGRYKSLDCLANCEECY